MSGAVLILQKKNLKNAKIDSDLDRPRRRFFGLIRLDVMSNNCIIVEKEQLTIIRAIHGDENYGRNIAEGFEAINFWCITSWSSS